MALKPVATDGFPTVTSQTQAGTEEVLLKHLPGPDAQEPTLNRSVHMQFLVKNLVQGFPAKYTSQDASQPWLMFWTIQSFSSLQVALDPNNKQRFVSICRKTEKLLNL